MLLSDSVDKIRRILRDTNSDVFSDGTLLRLWNDSQKTLVSQTGILRGYITLPVPPTTTLTYTYQWEEEFTSKPSSIIYDFLFPYTYTQPWEASILVNTTTEVDGGYTNTHGWESYYVTVQNRIKHYFPDDFLSATFMAFDEKPIDSIFRGQVERGNTSFKTREGVYPSIYIDNIENNVFYLYPKVVNTLTLSPLDGEYGEVCYDDSGELSFSSDYGVVTFATNEDLDSDYGVVCHYLGTENTIYLEYERSATIYTELTETIDLPEWCVKYVECGVLAKAFSTESDRFDKTLSKHFNSRFEVGLEVISSVLSSIKAMRRYKIEDYEAPSMSRGRVLADLPSHYPSLWRR